jgi:Transmembrane family 220, helix
MRYLNILSCLMMLGFAAVQYNDPDELEWIAIYTIPAAWAFMAAFFLPRLQASKTLMRLLWASAVLFIFLTLRFWPDMPYFWRKEVWYAEETAREGMGVMIALAVVLFALFTAWRKTTGERRLA